jgi:hypothetical protein
MRRDDSQIESAGQDSFLDVTTNIVGILIILVIVVAMRAQNPIPSAAAMSSTRDEIESLNKQAANIEYDVRRMGEVIASLDNEAEAKSEAREQLATMIAAAEKELNDRRAQLDSSKQEDFDLQQQVEANRQMIASASTELQDLKSRQAPVVQVNHYATPISRRMPNQVHFQVSGQRIAYIPLNDLADDVFHDVQHSGFGGPGSHEKTGIVGPRNGFELRYDVELFYKRDSGGQLNYEFQVSPTEFQLGETLQEAMRPQSDFMREVNRHSPKDTVVVLCVYPDSYALYQQLKEEVHKMGYGISLFPKETGESMGFSNHGIRADAQ